MARLIHIYFGLVLAIVCGPNAMAKPSIDCMGWYHNHATDEFENVPLTGVTYDPEYLEAKILHYEFGADLSYVSQEGIGLIIFNTQSRRSVTATAGFRRIGDTHVREAALTLYDVSDTKESIVLGLQCSYIEP